MVGRWGSKGSVGLIMPVGHRCHFEEDDREESEDEALDEADEEFEAKEGEGGDVREEERNDDQEHFPCEDVPEEPEGEGDDFRALRNKFQNADEAHDGIPPGGDEVFAGVGEDAESGNPENLGHRDGNESDRERHIHVGVHRAEEGEGDEMSFMHSLDGDDADSRQYPHPVCDDKEEEDRRDEGEKFSGFFAVLDD